MAWHVWFCIALAVVIGGMVCLQSQHSVSVVTIDLFSEFS